VFTLMLLTALAAASGLGVATILRRAGSEEQLLRRWMRAAKRTTIAEAPEGELVRIVGTVVVLEGRTVEAPLSGRPCTYYEALLEKTSDELTFDLWKVAARETGGVAFAIDDGTARAVVDPDLARTILCKDVIGAAGSFALPNEREQAFLARHALPEDAWMVRRLHRYREGVLEVGERVAVVGVVVREADPDPAAQRGYRDDAVRVRLTAGSTSAVAISDEPELTR